MNSISAIELKIWVIIAIIKKYKSIIKKKKRSMIRLAKCELNSVEVLISKALIYSNISHEELVIINNLPKEFYDMKNEKVRNSNNK